MRRLYRQVYMAIIASLVLVVLFGGIMWRFAPKPAPADEAFELAGEMVATLLPPASEGALAQQQAIDRLHDRLKMDIALFDKDLRGALPPSAVRCRGHGVKTAAGLWGREDRRGPFAFRMTDGLWRACRAGVGRNSSASSVFLVPSRWRWPSAPIRWYAGSRAGWSDCRPASSSSAPAISPRASRSKARTRWRGSRRASIAPPRGSRNWWARTSCC